MITEKEIEFKTEINEQQYNNLINFYNLKEQIYEVTNHYFDTPSFSFKKSLQTLRIRFNEQKNSYKLTLKKPASVGVYENHLSLDEKNALKMINSGFNLKEYFNIDLDVKNFGSLKTYRVTTPYKDGIIFFDKFTYFNITKYEIEYEVKNYHKGLKDFQEFLLKHAITSKKTKKKSTRFFEQL